ncbi:alpha-galactosidase [Microlunatus sp. Gsoil 973]|uniref:alpha-galactosidase n=1 Tax=Microlunatus sp. Gsoil 973 TaxID=2672569 RepID=UPI0012B4EBBA|nr:alpha-galactosidase [Microlunatus sp. Gsoil 973]QGN32748.1 alpha-galactosidase [Microlunatus sp. Gsoil 973]
MTTQLRVTADDGLLLDIDGHPALAGPAPVRLEIDRARRDQLQDPEITGSADDQLLVSGRVRDTGIAVSWTARRLAGRSVWELSMTLTNTGADPVAVARMDPLQARLMGGSWRTLAFRSAWGDEYRPEHGETDVDLWFETRAGRSAHGHSPWVGLERDGAGLVVAPAWSGNWHVDVTEGGTLTAGISNWLFETEIGPGDSIIAPSVVIAAGTDLETAAVELTAAVGSDWVPRSPASDRLDVEWNHWWPYEDAEVDENVIAANADLAAELGFGYATVDAGWFGPSDAGSFWSRCRGDWDLVNEIRFPAGLAALGSRIRRAGVRAGIWIEAEAVGRDARLRRERPEILALAVDGRRPDRSYGVGTESLDPDDPTFLGYVCCGSEQGRRFVRESLESVVQRTGAEWVKLDFNVDPDAGCTRTDHGHGAADGLYRHYLGLYQVLDDFRVAHPEVVLEACSSGGLRTDLGLARHVHCTFLSDPDYTEHHLQVLWGASLMLPPASILHWSWSQWRGDYPPAKLDFAGLSPEEFDATLRAAMLHRFGVSLRLPDLRPDQRESLRRHVTVFTHHVAPLVRDGVLHRLTGQPLRRGRGERTPAFQLSADDHHLLAAFGLPGSTGQTFVRPRGLAADRRYQLFDPFTGTRSTHSSAELADNGIPVPARTGLLSSVFVLLEPSDT